jgi:UDP-N-acetylmuramate--alanine ligase
VRFEPSLAGVSPLVAGLVRPGDLVLTVGAGDVTVVGPELLRLLEQRGVPT